MTNLPAILSTLDQEITALTERMQPSHPDFIAECLHRLKSGGMLVPNSIKAAEFLNEYTIALGGVPVHGLMTVVAKLKRGEYPGVSAEFMPLPAALAAMARAECRVVLDDLARLREKKSTLVEVVKPPELSPEERKRQIAAVRAMRLAFKRDHENAKAAVFSSVHIPMDNDKAEYWSKIQSLPDASSIDTDQAAFRRKIGNEVAAVEPRPPVPAPIAVDEAPPATGQLIDDSIPW